MNENVKVVFGLIGGLALFLFGMNSMSDALQKAAGEKMKKILGFLTRNPIMGALAGALVTAVLQSSSATTVMVIGFVSAGLMSLPQAISVIFGANIGTTMTAQLMAFKISNYIYPIIFIGFMLNFVGKKEKVKNIVGPTKEKERYGDSERKAGIFVKSFPLAECYEIPKRTGLPVAARAMR